MVNVYGGPTGQDGDVSICAHDGCSGEAVSWQVSWDVTGHQTILTPACTKHPRRKPTKKDVWKWAMHEIPRDVAEALARRAGR